MKFYMITESFYIRPEAFDQFKILDHDEMLDLGIKDSEAGDYRLYGFQGDNKMLIDVWYDLQAAEHCLADICGHDSE